MKPHPDFVITQELKAPLEKVWLAWATAENLQQWWGPPGYDLVAKLFQLAPGGIFLYGMSANGGPKMWGRFTYQEIEAPRRLVFIDSFSDEDGNLAQAPFGKPWPAEMLHVLTLQEKDGTTLLTLTGRPVRATPEEEQSYYDGHQAMHQSYSGVFDNLAKFLS